MAMKAQASKYDNAKHIAILADARIEAPTIGTNGNRKHGFEKRIRNRLMSEAGVDYIDAGDQVYSLMRAWC